MLLVRCFLKNEIDSRAEMQIECKPPGRLDWIRASRFAEEKRNDRQAAFYFATKATPQDGGDCVLVVYDPDIGEWQFRAWMVTREGVGKVKKVTVDFLAEGEGVTLTRDDQSDMRPLWPGDFTAPMRVVVSRAEK